MFPTLKFSRFLSPDAFNSLSPDANLFRFCSADATDAINPKIHFFHVASMLGLIYCIVCNLDFWKGDAKTKLQRMFSIYLTMTKTKTCTPKKDNTIKDLVKKREEPDYKQSEKMRRSWRKVSGRAGGGGGNGVAATTSFPVSGIMPPAPPAARLQSQKIPPIQKLPPIHLTIS